jgi:hypothetical protein
MFDKIYDKVYDYIILINLEKISFTGLITSNFTDNYFLDPWSLFSI